MPTTLYDKVYLKKRGQPVVRRLTLKSVLILSCSVIVLISTTLISFLTYHHFRTIMMEQFARSRVDVLRQVSARISGTNDTITVLSSFYFNNLPMELLARDAQAFGTQEQRDVIQQLRYLDEISQKTIEASGIDCHYVLSLNNGFSFCSQGNSETFALEKYQTKLWYSDIIHADGQPVWISTYANFDSSRQSRNYVYTLARSLVDPQTGESIGIFLFNILEPSISSAYDNQLGSNAIYVVDSNGKIVSHQNKDMLGINFFHMERLSNLLQGNDFCTIEKNRVPYLLSTCMNEDYNWMLIEEIPLADVLAPLQETQRNIITVDLTVLLITLIIISLIATRTAQPLRQLCRQLRQVGQSSSTTPFPVSGWQEICAIGEECNSMLARIHALIEDVKATETAKRKTELSLLQAQINPHFVYNTLFSIKCLVDMGDRQKALGIIDSFTAILKSNLSASDPFTTVEDEINMLNQYCTLQKGRYGDIFDCTITADPDLMSCRILRMLIQPLLENAIFHGVATCGHHGYIDICITTRGDDMEVIVQDNGVGIKAENLRALYTAAPEAKGQRSNFIGIRNITDRIALYFGDSYGLRVESCPGQGTTIRLLLPLLDDS